MDTIGTLREVCEVLTRDRLSPAAAREALGQSSTAWVRAGRVIADAGATEPNHVEFELPSAITMDALAHAFGEGHPAPRLHPQDPPEVLYYPAPLEGRQHACALIARLAGDGARTIFVRRDPRL